MGLLRRVLNWRFFFKAYLYVALIAGVLMFQVSSILGVFMMIHGVFVSAYPIDEESKIGRRVIECAAAFAFIVMLFGIVISSYHLFLGVLALFYGSY